VLGGIIANNPEIVAILTKRSSTLMTQRCMISLATTAVAVALITLAPAAQTTAGADGNFVHLANCAAAR
jgi:hypothetical protein